jgi:hypothetical protein
MHPCTLRLLCFFVDAIDMRLIFPVWNSPVNTRVLPSQNLQVLVRAWARGYKL